MEGLPGSIQLQDVTAGYGRDLVFSRFSLSVKPGEFVYVLGPSGSGKSTLFKILYGALRPERGLVQVDGVALHRLPSRRTARIRRRVSCVFQTYELLPHLTTLENVLLPLRLAHPRIRDPKGFALDALELVGLQDKLHEFPGNLSGGQQQRVAVARAIAHQPRILLADEPTGNVDTDGSAEIVELFRQLNKLGSTVMMATHDQLLLSWYPAPAIQLRPALFEMAS